MVRPRFRNRPKLTELTKIGARMMLQVALEEEITAHLARDHYERTSSAKGRRNGSKPRTVKIGGGDIGIWMPQARNAGMQGKSGHRTGESLIQVTGRQGLQVIAGRGTNSKTSNIHTMGL